MAVAGGTIWLVYHGLVLLALSYTTMGVFTNLSPTELHPNVPLATPIPSDFFDETTQYMMGRRSGWCGELLTMAVAMLGAAWQFCDSPQASNALAKWWGRAFLAQLCAFWVAPLYEATIFKACWVWFFWAAFGGAWLWAEFGLETPKRRPPAWKSNLQPDFNVRVCDGFDASSSSMLRELDESNRSVQKSAESTSI